MYDEEDAGMPGGLPPIAPPEVLRKFAFPSQLDFEIEFYAGMLARNPNYVQVLRVMGNNLTAKGDYQRSLEVDRRLVHLCPQDYLAHYNLACSYSRLEMIEPALQALGKAIETGYAEFDYMQEDRDLEPLRKDPRFRELLAAHGIL